jgi:nucleotide-binding universal stress UspA family protein
MVLPINTILCPTDFSESSVAAFQIARALAEHCRARLVILYVESPRAHAASDAATAKKDETEAELVDQLRSHLLVSGNTPVEYQIVHGVPKDLILETAGRIRADVIVMGTHGRSGVGRMLMGSVAEAISRAATCPVVAVRGQFAVEHRPDSPHSLADQDVNPVDLEAGPEDWRTIPGPFERARVEGAARTGG